MNDTTPKIPEHDLCYDTTKVSFPLLLKTVTIAVAYTKWQIERRLSDIQNASLANNLSALATAARQLAEDAQALDVAANTLMVLNESKRRPILKVIGKPEEKLT